MPNPPIDMGTPNAPYKIIIVRTKNSEIHEYVNATGITKGINNSFLIFGDGLRVLFHADEIHSISMVSNPNHTPEDK